MRYISFQAVTVILALANIPGLAFATALESRNVLQDLQDQAIAALQKAETNSTLHRGNCTISNASIRRDWEWMTKQERKAYIDAVQCITSLPSKTDPKLVPGARTRYDDFVAQHINQTSTIHGTGNFLSWHRLFVYSYEQALRNECGYKGYQPYWNWFSHYNDLKNHPVFDGSDTRYEACMSGDGEFVSHNGSLINSGSVFLPSGEGGGCIKNGPFKGLMVNLGPVAPVQDGVKKPNSTFAPNPRCLKRDLSSYSASTWLTIPNLLNITVGAASKNIQTFQDELQGRNSDGFLGLHGAGHYTMGGDAGDVFSSPNDPIFFLHHAMVDRVWWIWQSLHLEQARSVAGTITMFNEPPSRNATLDDMIGFEYLDIEATKIRDVLSTLDGTPLCYIYL